MISARVDYVLSLADDALVSAQRMGEWIATSPQIEEDVALGNIALDLLGQARSLLTYAGSLQDPPRTEDDLAYLREAGDFRPTDLDQGVALQPLRYGTRKTIAINGERATGRHFVAICAGDDQ